MLFVPGVRTVGDKPPCRRPVSKQSYFVFSEIPQPTRPPPQSPPSSCWPSSTPVQSGHPATGAVRSTLLPGGSSRIQSEKRAGMKQFHAYCISLNITTFPLPEHTLCYYATYLADQNLAPQTIKSYLSALRNEHITLGFPDLRDKSSLTRLKRVQAGISKSRLLGG